MQWNCNSAVVRTAKDQHPSVVLLSELHCQATRTVPLFIAFLSTKRGLMNTHLKALLSLMLATALVAGQAQTTANGTTSAAAKTTSKKKTVAKKPAKPS